MKKVVVIGVMIVFAGLVALASEGFLGTIRQTVTGGSIAITNLDANVAIAEITVSSPRKDLVGTNILCQIANSAAVTSVVFETDATVYTSTTWRAGLPCKKWQRGGVLLFSWGPTNTVNVEIETVSY